MPAIGTPKLMYCAKCRRKQQFIFSKKKTLMGLGSDRKAWKCSVCAHEIEADS